LAQAIIYGEALELGFYLGLAQNARDQFVIDVLVGTRFDPPILDRRTQQPLRIFLEGKLGVTLEQARGKFILNSSVSEALPVFRHYYRVKQRTRTQLEHHGEMEHEIFENEAVSHSALRMIKTGYQAAIAVLQHARREWGDGKPGLEILVEPSLGGKLPDFIIIRNKLAGGIGEQLEFATQDLQDTEVVCIGDVKSYLGFVSLTSERLLVDYIDQFIVEGFSRDKLESHGLAENKSVSSKDFYRLMLVLQKYLKVFAYAELFYRETGARYQSLDVLLVLPGAIPAFNVKSAKDLRRVLRFLRHLVPSRIVDWSTNPPRVIALEDHERKRLLELLMEGKIRPFSRNDPSDSDNRIYGFTGNGLNELQLIFKGHKAEFTDSFKVRGKLQPEIVKRTHGSTSGLKEARDLHMETFLDLLHDKDYRLIINGSAQGIGKNTAFKQFIVNLAGSREEFTLLFFCPRIHTLKQMEADIRQAFETSSIKDVNLVLTVSQREQNLIRSRRTFKQLEIVHETTGHRLVAALKASGKNVILATSQALDYFLKHPYNWRLLFSKVTMVFFDELTNSGPAVTKNFIDLLIETRDRLTSSRPFPVPRFTVLDASITSKWLFLSMLNALVDPNSKKWLVPFHSTYREETSSNPYPFTISNTPLKGVFLRQEAEFNIDYGVSARVITGNYRSANTFEKILADTGKLVAVSRVSRNNGNLKQLLEEGKIIFYVNNKQFVDSLVEYLQLKGYGAVAITHDAREALLLEGTVKKNIVGTSSLAFGTTYSWHEVLVILPPFPLKIDYGSTNYFDSILNLEYFRQVAKRMRGKNSDMAPRLIAMISVLDKEAGIKLQNIKFYMLRNYIKDILVNPNQHVLSLFSRSKYTKEKKHRVSLYGGISKRSFTVNTVYLDDFLREYFPAIKNALNHFQFYPSPEFLLEFDTSGLWSNMAVPSFLFYKISGQQVARNFRVSVKTHTSTSVNKMIVYLIRPGNLYSVNKGLEYLEKLVKSFHGKNSQKDNRSSNYPHLLHFVTSARNQFSLAKRMQNLLSPSILFASDSYLLVTLDIMDDYELVMSEDFEKEVMRRLRSIGSPLSGIYFGDMNLLEEPMRVIVKSGETRFITYGFVISHPKLGVNPAQIHNLLSEALGYTTIRKNTLLLPKILKYLAR
jgi:hypothetical protein